MSVPPLRQPKASINCNISCNKLAREVEYVILTLEDRRKLVIPSDSYHGLVRTGDEYKCLFCNLFLPYKGVTKDLHVKSSEHKRCMEMYPHVTDFCENLIREISKEISYCTICNVTISNNLVSRHISSVYHKEEIDRALLRAENYKPFEPLTIKNDI